MTATTSPLLDGVTYPRNKVHAPCWGANHDHSRAIATCNTCGREVVIYQGRVLPVAPNARGARNFTCWADSHRCVDPKGADAQALSDAYYAAKKALDDFREEAITRARGASDEQITELMERISDLQRAIATATAAAHDAGLTWIGWEV